MRSLQEIFNIAYLGLASQGFEQADDGLGGCAYRSFDGKKCAIGYCISDEDYDSEIEGDPAWMTSVYDKLDTKVATTTLAGLQKCHDCSDGPDDMKIKLFRFAEKHNLTIPKDPVL